MLTVIWDWNGTLLDDMDLGLAIMDRILSRRGLVPLGELSRYREIFTFPVRDYYALAGIDLDREDFTDLAEEYMSDYRAHESGCPLMEGARETLRALDGMGVTQVLASASRQDDLERQVSARGLDGVFQAVLGMTDDLGGGKSGLAESYIRAHDLDPEEVVFVGDTIHDWETARSVGCRCVLIAGGHQSRERLAATGAAVLGSINELPGYLSERRDK